jgi:hypothetical protein
MNISFKAKIIIINKKGTGLIRIPKDDRILFMQGEQVKITINAESKKVYLFSKIISKSIGVYIPKSLMNKWIIGEHEVNLEKSNDLFVNIGSDGRIYLPISIGEKMNLEDGGIIKIRILFENKPHTLFCKLSIRIKPKTKEYMILLPNIFYKKDGIITQIRKFKKNSIKNTHNLDFISILKDINFAEVSKNDIILYLGNRVPIIINKNISLESISHYLGCFFADGTKRGNDWGICASTFEQGNYFKRMHNLVISDNKIIFSLTATLDNSGQDNIDKFIELWERYCKVHIKSKQVIFSDSKGFTNRNKYGTLIFKEHRQLTQLYYNRLVLYLLDRIKIDKNAILAKEFVCGVMEGDGCLNAKNRGHIQITSNDKEVKILEEFLSYTGLDFHKHKEISTGKVYINVGGLSIIEDIVFFEKILFRYYPKRRKILSERLCNTPAANYLMSKQPKISSWILKRFRDKGILDKNNQLTDKGKRIKSTLLNLKKEAIFITY